MAAALVLSACDDGVSPTLAPSVSLSTRNQTIRVGESFQLSASIRGESASAGSRALHWSSLDEAVATVTQAGLVTGHRPGLARVVAEAAGAADTSRIQVARTPATIVIDSLSDLAPGDLVQLSATITDTEGVEITAPVEWSVAPATVGSVDGEGGLTLLGEGVLRISAASPPARAEIEVEVRVAPPPEDCAEGSITLARGEVRRYAGGAPISLCLSGGAEYTLVATNAGSTAATADLSAEGLSSPSAPAADNLLLSRSVASARPALGEYDREFERRLRRSERERLSPRGARTSFLSRSLQTSASREVGDLMQLSTSTSCESPDARTGRVEYVGERAIVVADTANPRGLTRSDYARFGAMYDTLLYPVVTEHFGEPATMNGERRVVIFYTRAVNELTPAGSEGVVGGYFWAGDLFPTSECAGSNQREMFYMLAADPEGEVNGNERSVESVERATAGTIAHELQHLINASRRIFLNDAEDWEEPWLNEGLSHIAEELVFYHRSGYGARENLGPAQLGGTSKQLDITNRHAISNLLRVDRYLREVEQQGPFQGDDDLATRGAAWQFLRYAMDRHGGDPRMLLSTLVDSRTSGLENVEAVFDMDAADWFADAAISLFTDDHVPGIGDVHQQPSWNFRTLFDWINGDGFVLRNRPLRNEELSVHLQGWGTAYLRTAVGTGRTGNIRVGSAEAPPSASLELALVRTR